MNLAEPIDIRTGRPFADRVHPHHRETPLERASTGGVSGRARGLLGGLFGGCLMASQSRLPYDAEVEYLANDTSYAPYIDTGFVSANGPYRMEYEFCLTTSVSRTSYPFGSWGANNHRFGVALLSDSSGARIEFRLGSYYYGGYNAIVGTWYNHVCDGVELKYYIDGNLVWTNTGGDTRNDNRIRFFASGGDDGQMYAYIRVRKFKLTDGNGTVVLDLKPVRVGTVGYFYDSVTKALFGNSGTGAFVVGPDKS